MTPLIAANSLNKSFLGAPVLKDVGICVDAGSLTVITGPSGSGKTTLLNLIAGLDTPDAGEITVGGVSVTSLNQRQRTRFRATLGHVFQRSGLLGGLTVRENIEAPHLLSGHEVDSDWVEHLVELLGITELLDVPATRISGGQAQRAAVVRCLAHAPRIVFADEPTASLDTASKHLIHELLLGVVRSQGVTVLMVSHDEISTHYATDQIGLLDGRTTDPRNQ